MRTRRRTARRTRNEPNPIRAAQYGAHLAEFAPFLAASPRGRYSSRASASGCGEIGIHAGFRCLWALRPWRFESSQPHHSVPALERSLVSQTHSTGRCYPEVRCPLPLSSRGLGRRPLTAETGVRIPVAVLTNAPEP